jgi:hypothetical protein
MSENQTSAILPGGRPLAAPPVRYTEAIERQLELRKFVRSKRFEPP